MSAFVYPLISIPYLSRIFGTSGLGQLLLAMSIINVMVLVVDFGFGMSALRRVALAETVKERSHIVSSTLAAKVLLLIVSVFILGILVLVIPDLRAHWELYVIGSALTIGAAAYPTWLLQGIGKIKTFAVLHAASRLIALAGLLLTVKSGSDGNLAIFWQFAPATIAAGGSWIYLSIIGCHQVVRPTWHEAISAIRESTPLFVGSVATIMISAMNTVFLGIFSTIQQVAFYGAGERLSNALRGVLGGVQQSLLPRVSASIGSERGAALRRTVTAGLVAAYGLAGVGLIVSAGILVPWYLGPGFDAVIPVAELLGAALCVTGLSTALTLLLIAHGQAKISSRVLLRAALVHLVLLPIGCINFGAIGAAGAVCLTELLIAIMLGWSFRAFTQQATGTQPADHANLPGGNIMNPTVTVVIPVYNNEDFVARAVHSVLDQSFTDFELIIIDDSSTDCSLSIVRQAVNERPESDREKVRIICREQNLGYSAATNTGVSLARGRWIWFVDGDDWAEPDMLLRLMEAATFHAAQIAVARIRAVRAATGAARIIPEWTPRASVSTGTESLKHLARGDIGSFQTNKLVSRDIWVGVLSPGNAYGDLAIMPKLFSLCERIAFVNEPLYNYSLHPGSTTGSLRSNVWDLTALHSFVDPILDEIFTPRLARALRRHFAYRLVYRPLIHSSAADVSSGGLAEEIQSWTRHQIRWTDLLWLAARGRVALVASLGLAKGSPNLHKKLFRYYKGRTS